MRNHLRTVLESFEEMQSINLSNLKNPIHREFIKDSLKGARDSQAVILQLAAYLQWLEDAYEEEMQASLIEETVQRLTQEVYDLAEQRGLQQTAVKSGYRALMGSTDADKVAVGTVLFNLAHKYDLHTGMNVDEQTAVIDSFILDVEQNYLPQLEATGQTDLFNQLKRLNDAVCDKVVERDKAKVGLGTGRMANARLESDKAWRALRYAVNSKSFLEGYQPFAEFIGYMNVLIVRYKRVHLGESVSSPVETPGTTTPDEVAPGTPGGDNTNPGGGTNTNPGDNNTNPGGDNTNPGGDNTNPGGGNDNTNPGGGNDNTDKVTVTFHFENGGTETREYPKGTILRPGGTNYPANTPGYNWSILNVTLNSDTNAWEVSEGDSGLD